ncbi:MAG: hypothetical protein HY720_25525 [Planctomycetes bacterium]|nr:hypothetical protein [Planctomycetota bacterium]
MSDVGIREFCQIALGKNFTTPDRVKEVVSECVRARRAGREMPVGEIFMTHRYLDRRQVAEIMKEIYGPESVVAVETLEPPEMQELPVPLAPLRSSSPVAGGDSTLPPPCPGNGAPATAPDVATASPPPLVDFELPHSALRIPHSKGPLSGRSPATRIGPWRNLPWAIGLAILAIPLAGLLAFSVAAWVARDTEPAVSALPASSPEVVLSRELGRQIAIERAVWADADGKGRLVLLVHYVLTQGTRLPDMVRRVRVTAVHDRAAIESFEVEVRMNYDELKALSERVDVPLLGPGGVLRESPSGILVLPLDYPALVDSVILCEAF